MVSLADLQAIDASILSFHSAPISRLWGGSGDSCEVARVRAICTRPRSAWKKSKSDVSFVMKHVKGVSRRHEHNEAKARLKHLSYMVEFALLPRLTLDSRHFCVPKVFLVQNKDESRIDTAVMLMEDMRGGYPGHYAELRTRNVELSLDWLAFFHHTFSTREFLVDTWKQGTFWALDKRGQELKLMQSRFTRACEDHAYLRRFKHKRTFASRLRSVAKEIARVLYPAPAEDVQELAGYSSDASELVEEAKAPSYLEFKHHLTVNEGFTREDTVEREREGITKTLALEKDESTTRKPKLKGIQNNFTLLHGDYKSENIFFARDQHSIAVCDFQWSGYGVGALDVMHLLHTSLEKGLRSSYFVDYYADLVKGWYPMFRKHYQLALVDYARYMIGTGMVFEEDVDLMYKVWDVLEEINREEGEKFKHRLEAWLGE